jgi:hypothetical protein
MKPLSGRCRVRCDHSSQVPNAAGSQTIEGEGGAPGGGCFRRCLKRIHPGLVATVSPISRRPYRRTCRATTGRSEHMPGYLRTFLESVL